MPGTNRVRCRQIGEADCEGIADLLARGFPGRPQDYWAGALERLRARAVPEGYPRYGFMLEQAGRPVGAVLLICQTVTHQEPAFVRCNLASWYVEPAVRSQAAMLSAMPLRLKGATFLNTSPAPNTHAIIEAQGFVRYTGGQLLALPLLGAPGRGLRLEAFNPGDPGHAGLAEAQLLADHRATGCLSLVGRADDGLHPFVLLPVRVCRGRWPLPGAQLVYCRGVDEVVRFARPLGALLARQGRPVLLLDADGPIRGLPGVFLRNRVPKYVRGAHRPRHGDLAYTEFCLFGA